jgi:hypothetical protein
MDRNANQKIDKVENITPLPGIKAGDVIEKHQIFKYYRSDLPTQEIYDLKKSGIDPEEMNTVNALDHQDDLIKEERIIQAISFHGPKELQDDLKALIKKYIGIFAV